MTVNTRIKTVVDVFRSPPPADAEAPSDSTGNMVLAILTVAALTYFFPSPQG